MNRFSTMKKGLALAALVGAMTVFSAARADAALVAWICNDAACDGVGDVSATDGGLGDLDPSAGVVLFTSPGFNGFEVSINTSQSKPALANGMDLAYVVTNTSGAASPIWLFATDDTFMNGPGTATGTLGGTHDTGTITAYICGGDSNVLTGNFAPCTTASDNLGVLTSIALTHPITANPYSLAIGVGISADANVVTGNFRVTVPEPLSIALFGLGLSGVAMYRRRRMQVA